MNIAWRIVITVWCVGLATLFIATCTYPKQNRATRFIESYVSRPLWPAASFPPRTAMILIATVLSVVSAMLIYELWFARR
jgi:hypothetical protein